MDHVGETCVKRAHHEKIGNIKLLYSTGTTVRFDRSRTYALSL